MTLIDPHDPHDPQTAHDVPEDVYASWSASVAPDGARVAFVSDRTGEPRVWIEGPEPGRLVMPAGVPPRVSTVAWSPDGAWLACEVAAAGASRRELWVVRPDGTDALLVAGDEGRTADLGDGSWHGWTAGGRLMVTESEGVVSTCFLLDPGTARREVLLAEPLVALVDVDRAGENALLRVGPRGARHLELLRIAGGARRRLVTGPGPGNVEVAALTPDGAAVLAVSDAGRDRAALVRVPVDAAPAGGEQDPRPAVLAAHPQAEVEDVVVSWDGDRAVVLWNVHGGTSRVSLLDLRDGGVGEVPQLPRTVVDDCRFRPDGKGLVLTAESWADPRGVWAVDLVSGAAEPLSSPARGALTASKGASTPGIEIEDLTRPVLVRFPARDGTELSGWLYRPAGPGPWPATLWLHGGPESQERPVYNSLFQSLVAAGVAVFAANVRGSSGFGRAFLEADDRERRFAAIDDVADCAQHLVSAGIAERGRIGCAGRSYGGWLTLAALTWYPELFGVGVDVCGMADFATFYRHTEPWIAAAAVAEYGHPEHDAQLLASLSPIHRIDRLRAPLLVVHGADDTNVPVEEAEQVVAALAERGVAHRYLLFPGEGHELMLTPNRVTFVQTTVAWIAEHLGVAP